jgi:hypothetical protein
VNLADDLRLRERQQIVVALEIMPEIAKTIAAVVSLVEPVTLNHRAHGAIENQDALSEQRLELVNAGVHRYG